ncbi:MAG TPA: T9SS type A sorting domain-containing protein [Ignavibacteriaceae bacterium]
MKIFTIFFSILLFSTLMAQSQPQISFNDLLISSEENPQMKLQAREIALKNNLPWSIYLSDKIFIEALGVENEKPVYAVITNLLNPYEGGSTAFFEEIGSKYDLASARINYGNGKIINPTLGYPEIIIPTEAVSFLLFSESTNDKVWSINATTGDVINPDYIPTDPVNLNTPTQARLSPGGKITISDQNNDGVFAYDTLGVPSGIFAPAGGVNLNILDNVRGHNYRPNGNLLVTVAGSANSNSIAEFDGLGNYLGQFITAGSGGLNSPWDILFRTNDVLISASSSDAIHRYDLTGAYLDNFYQAGTTSYFPEQMQELSNSNIAVADFGVGGGVKIYSNTGTPLTTLGVVTANRGVYGLPNGNFLTTNAAGLFEINGTTGDTVRQIIAGVSGRFITPYDLAIIPVELTSFVGSSSNGRVELSWTTATELNNSGFEIQRSSDGYNYIKIGFVPGNGTTSEPKAYNFIDNNSGIGKQFYRLRQIDFDGTFNYSGIVEVDVAAPIKYLLEQNYPNPFNPSTMISYSIPQNSFVTLKVYDIIGNEVATLVNQTQSAGKYDIRFDASNLSNGVYLYTIKTDNFSSTKKMILMK